MVIAAFFKKAAIYGAAASVIGAAFFHHRIQGEQRSVLSSQAKLAKLVVYSTGAYRGFL